MRPPPASPAMGLALRRRSRSTSRRRSSASITGARIASRRAPSCANIRNAPATSSRHGLREPRDERAAGPGRSGGRGSQRGRAPSRAVAAAIAPGGRAGLPLLLLAPAHPREPALALPGDDRGHLRQSAERLAHEHRAGLRGPLHAAVVVSDLRALRLVPQLVVHGAPFEPRPEPDRLLDRAASPHLLPRAVSRDALRSRGR